MFSQILHLKKIDFSDDYFICQALQGLLYIILSDLVPYITMFYVILG